jgi:hypothetical protein
MANGIENLHLDLDFLLEILFFLLKKMIVFS